MKKLMSFINKNTFLLMFLAIMFIYLFNMLFYFNKIEIYGLTLNQINAFSFWKYVRYSDLGSIVLFISPIIILCACLSSFFSKIASGIFNYFLLRKSYFNFLKVEIFKTWIKAGLIITISSAAVLLIGNLIIHNANYAFNNSIPLLNFYKEGMENPFVFFLQTLPLNFIYGMFIANIGIIIMYYVKKFYLILISSFIVVNLVNLVVGNILLIIAKVINIEAITNEVYFINIYNGYSPDSFLLSAYVQMIVYFIISLIIIIFIYRNKERLILKYD